MQNHTFVQKVPTLWHLAQGDTWPSLQEYGLLSTDRLVRLCGVPDGDTLLRSRRPEAVTLQTPDGHPVLIRDQAPMVEDTLAAALAADGMTVPDWIYLMNSMVFFAPSREAIEPLMVKYLALGPVLLLEVNTRTILSRYNESVRLSSINTAYTLRKPTPRGRATFRSVSRFDKTSIKEVAVLGGVTDLRNHLRKVERFTAVDAEPEVLLPAPA